MLLSRKYQFVSNCVVFSNVLLFVLDACDNDEYCENFSIYLSLSLLSDVVDVVNAVNAVDAVDDNLYLINGVIMSL